MVRAKAIDQINSILLRAREDTTFGHSFRIGGASHYVANNLKVDLEIVRMAGRWKLLAYEVYIRSFENMALIHLGNLEESTN
jgi:hypothetical protein